MPDLGLTLPLRIVQHEESVEILDAAGRKALYVYFADDAQRASVMRRVTREQAIEIAKLTARALTDALERAT